MATLADERISIMNTVVHSHVKKGGTSALVPTRKPLMVELDNYTENQRVVIRICRHLVKHKYRELLEWCQRVKTDKVEVMATMTDVRMFSKDITIPEFVKTAKGLKNADDNMKDCFKFNPIMDVCQIPGMPALLSIKFTWEVFNWLVE